MELRFLEACSLAVCVFYRTKHCHLLGQRCTTFSGQGPQRVSLFLVHSRAEDSRPLAYYELNF